MNPGVEQFPRELTQQEKYLLFSVLPENKPGYRRYREKINELLVTGYGRFKNNNFILGKRDNIPDLSFPSAPVFAAGTIKIPDDEIDILINEETDDEIEFDLTLKNSELIPVEIKELTRWSYSDWNPGDKSPDDFGQVREVFINDGNYVLVFAPTHKKIWLHENKSGVNYLIPLTNFYNELMGYKRIKDPKEALNPGLLFIKLNNYSDIDLLNAFVLYNKYMRRFSVDFSKYLLQPRSEQKKSIKDLFRKGKS
ncbi:MAG TPA: hypothetical protein VLB50_03790 [Ignavibacteriaceae bacterium]|nr:hypothetical protein [Ignavibacteriaceae bacterium]